MARPSKYQTHVVPRFEEIKKWLKRGATDKEIAKALGIAESTFSEYKVQYSELKELLKKHRIDAVEEIKAALFKRATGFQYTETKKTTQSMQYPDEVKAVLMEYGLDVEKLATPIITKTETTRKTALPDVAASIALLKHWAADEGWTNDPQTLKLKKEELKLKKESADKDW